MRVLWDLVRWDISCSPVLRAQAVFGYDLLEANVCCMHIRSCTRTCMVQGCYLVSQSASKGCALYAWTLDQTLIAEEKEWQLCPYHLKTLCHFQGSAGLVKCNCFQHVHKPKCFVILAQDQRLTSLVWYTPWILNFFPPFPPRDLRGVSLGRINSAVGLTTVFSPWSAGPFWNGFLAPRLRPRDHGSGPQTWFYFASNCVFSWRVLMQS